MNPRQPLPNRRTTVTTNFQVTSQTTGTVSNYILSVGLLAGKILEVFVNTDVKRGSESDTNVSDAAVAVSLALQYGCPLETLRDAMKRNSDGTPQGPIGGALDAAAKLRDE